MTSNKHLACQDSCCHPFRTVLSSKDLPTFGYIPATNQTDNVSIDWRNLCRLKYNRVQYCRTLYWSSLLSYLSRSTQKMNIFSTLKLWQQPTLVENNCFWLKFITIVDFTFAGLSLYPHLKNISRNILHFTYQ